MRFLFLAFGLLITAYLPAQFGFSGNVTSHNIRTTFFDGVETAEALELNTGYEISANYWFRLPTKRVEFMPSIYYGTATYTASNDLRFNEFGFQFKTNVYPFDFGGDCDCPTFGKQGPQLQKGFFLQVSPGYALYSSSGFGTTENRAGFTIGGGAGLDIGLSNLVTLTPVVTVRHGIDPFVDIQYTDINGQAIGVDQPKLTTFLAGLQVSIRFDHKRY